MRKITIVVAILIVASLVIGYWAVIGFASPIDDFDQDGNGDSDGDGIPDSEDDDPGTPVVHDWDAYATFKITCSAYWVTNLVAHGAITQIVPDVEPFEDMATGRVYEDLDLLRGHEEMKGQVWIEVSVTGSGNFEAQWTSDKWTILEKHTSVNPLIPVFNTGRVFFENPGTYEIFVTMNAQMLDDIPYKLTTKYQTFEVDMP